MATYQKLNDCPQTFTILQHNDAIDSSVLTVLKNEVLSIDPSQETAYVYNYQLDSKLIGTRMSVYIGFEDDTGKFEGNNTEGLKILDSDTSNCQATAQLISYVIGSDGYRTASLIKFSLNKCTADRTITFSYNSLPIFKIKQNYYTAPSKLSLLYAVYLYGLRNVNANNLFAWFTSDAPSSFTENGTFKYIQFTVGDFSDTTDDYLMFWYSDNMKIFAQDLTVSKILGNLTHYSGNDKLSNYGNYYYETMNKIVNVYNTSKPTTKIITLSDTVCLYKVYNKTYTKVDEVCFCSTTASYHLGCYKQN